jgi:hypothetical protein|tara:strand:- start:10 stop:477 length:468 start_codon:yes stop_codon:yes gene_type:complete
VVARNKDRNELETSEPERLIVVDLVKRGLKVAPIWILLAGLVWGVDGAASATYGLVLILANFVMAAAFLTWAGRISPAALMAAALGGFIFRLIILTIAVVAVRNLSMFLPVPLGITIIVSHLGLLTWETRYVSLSLAHPGLVPDASKRMKGQEKK